MGNYQDAASHTASRRVRRGIVLRFLRTRVLREADDPFAEADRFVAWLESDPQAMGRRTALLLGNDIAGAWSTGDELLAWVQRVDAWMES